MYCVKSGKKFGDEPPLAPEDDEAAPNPTPYKSQRSLPLCVPLLFVPLPCPPVFERLVYCDDSTGPVGAELLLPLLDDPVPDPEPPRSTGPFGSELLLPPLDELVPDPEPPRSTGPFGAELLLPPLDDPVPDPEPPRSTGPFDREPPVPAAEPSVGLPPLKMIPGGGETPGSKTAVIDPKPLRESCPNPASIARDSRRSITASSVEARGGFLVFRRFTGLLLGRPLKRGHIPLIGVQCRKSFQFSKGIGSRGNFIGGGGESNQLGSPGKGSSPGDEGPTKRFRPANGDEDCRSNPGTVRDASSPNPASASRSPHHGHDPGPDGSWLAVPDGSQFGHLGRIASASMRLPNRSASSAGAAATPRSERAGGVMRVTLSQLAPLPESPPGSPVEGSTRRRPARQARGQPGPWGQLRGQPAWDRGFPWGYLYLATD